MLLLDSPPSLILLLLDSPSSLFDPPVLDPCPGVSPAEGHRAPDGPQGHNPVRGEGRKLIIEVRLVLCPMSSLTLPPQSYHWTGEGIVPAHRPRDTAGDYTTLGRMDATNRVVQHFIKGLGLKLGGGD